MEKEVLSLPAKSWEINSLKASNQFIETLRQMPRPMQELYVSEDFNFERHEFIWKEFFPMFGQGYPAVDHVVEKSCNGYLVLRNEIQEAKKELEDD